VSHPLQALVGVWQGEGVARFPTIVETRYTEELAVEHDAARDVLVYEQKVRLPDGSVSHREVGFIQVLDDGGVQLWNVQNNGRVEVLRGSLEGLHPSAGIELDLRSVGFENDPRMLGSTRRIRVEGESLTYEQSMATTTAPDDELRPHLSARLSLRARETIG